MKVNPHLCARVTRVSPLTLCGKPAIGTIGEKQPSGYCEEHAAKARLMFGKLKMIVKEEMFDEKEFRK